MKSAHRGDGESAPEEERDPAADGYSFAEYPVEELLEQAQANGQAAILATIRFLKQRGIPIDDWTASLGETFATAWSADDAWAVDEFMDAMLVNFRSLGAVVAEVDLRIDQANALVTGFPDLDLATELGVEAADADRYHDATVLLARRHGIDWSWSRDDDGIRLSALPVGA